MIISDLNYIQTVDAKEVEGGFSTSFANSNQIILLGAGTNAATTRATSLGFGFFTTSTSSAGSAGVGVVVAQTASAGSLAV